MRYLDAELVVCRSVVEFPACDGAEDVTVLQIRQQLQVAGLLLFLSRRWTGGREVGRNLFKS